MNLQINLDTIAQQLGWHKWSTGVSQDGMYFVEYETDEQYDEWQFSDEGSAMEFLKSL
jgi:hypothetical protein